MILRTETYRDLEEDLATIMDIDELFLYEKLHEISSFLYNSKCRE